MTKPIQLNFEQSDLETLNHVLEITPAPMYLKSIDGIYVNGNSNFLTLIGLKSPKELIGKSDAELSWKLQALSIQKNDQLVLNSFTEQEFEETFTIADNSIKNFKIRKKAFNISSKNLIIIMGVCVDITKNKKIEDKKKQAELYLKNIVSNLPGLIFWKDKNGVYLGTNLKQAQAAGFNSPSEVIGKTDYELRWIGNQAEILRENDKRIMESGIPESLEEGGGEAAYFTSKIPLRGENNEVIGILGISLDITIQKEAEAREKAALAEVALAEKQKAVMEKQIELFKRLSSTEEKHKQTELLLQNIISNLPGLVYWKNKNSIYLGSNHECALTAGLDLASEMIGKTDYQLSWKDQADILRATDSRVMKDGISESVEEFYVREDGRKVTYITNKVPLRGQDNEIIGILGISLDITAQKDAEAREKSALEESMIAKKQIEFMEKQVQLFKQLSGTVAHELNTPLRGIQLGVETVKRFLPPLLKTYDENKKEEKDRDLITEKGIAGLETTLNNTTREIDASFLFIEMLLANIRAEKFDDEAEEKFSMKDLVEEALERYPLNYKQKEKIFVNMDYNFNFKGSRKLLVHVLFNLLKNALFYLGEAGKGEITIWCEEKENANELHFKDTGAGISEEILPHIFDQFFSRTRHGTGIGLTYCKMVMASFHGGITCKSTKGEYTEFILSFPKAN